MYSLSKKLLWGITLGAALSGTITAMDPEESQGMFSSITGLLSSKKAAAALATVGVGVSWWKATDEQKNTVKAKGKEAYDFAANNKGIVTAGIVTTGALAYIGYKYFGTASQQADHQSPDPIVPADLERQPQQQIINPDSPLGKFNAFLKHFYTEADKAEVEVVVASFIEKPYKLFFNIGFMGRILETQEQAPAFLNALYEIFAEACSLPMVKSWFLSPEFIADVISLQSVKGDERSEKVVNLLLGCLCEALAKAWPNPHDFATNREFVEQLKAQGLDACVVFVNFLEAVRLMREASYIVQFKAMLLERNRAELWLKYENLESISTVIQDEQVLALGDGNVEWILACTDQIKGMENAEDWFWEHCNKSSNP